MNLSLGHLEKRRGWRATLVIDANLSSREDFYLPKTSKEISNPADLELLKQLRSLTDVIVTTGKTARVEEYKTSKFAPIAVLTDNESEIRDLPLFESDKNFSLTLENPLSTAALEAELRQRGFDSFLFEGGLQVLDLLLQQAENFELVLSVTGSEQDQEVDAAQYLKALFPAQAWQVTNQWRDRGNLVVVAHLIKQ